MSDATKPLGPRLRATVLIVASAVIGLSLAGLAYLIVILNDRDPRTGEQAETLSATTGEMMLLVLCALGIISALGGLVLAWARSRG